ncbi:hypothetical protein [uncultured Allobaculum sp.]|uniref:hypothetical protein n=1 Tax=uncultured Allobaculum sp. TaxID=1187017 RepID=UPI00259B4D76|nr:hypothetical protein [uncultured Allobaculum sp.]
MHFVNIRFFKGDIYIPVLRDFTGSVWAVFFPFFLHFSGEFAGMESCLSGLFSARRSSSSLFFLYIYILLYPSIAFFLLPIYMERYRKTGGTQRLDGEEKSSETSTAATSFLLARRSGVNISFPEEARLFPLTAFARSGIISKF